MAPLKSPARKTKSAYKPKLNEVTEALRECLAYIEWNSHGLMLDVKDTARMALYGQLRPLDGSGCECLKVPRL